MGLGVDKSKSSHELYIFIILRLNYNLVPQIKFKFHFSAVTFFFHFGTLNYKS
jgi:hypothetical protein